MSITLKDELMLLELGTFLDQYQSWIDFFEQQTAEKLQRIQERADDENTALMAERMVRADYLED